MRSALPINLAEAIIEPFWDPAISGFPKWSVVKGDAHALSINQNWCNVQFQWSRRPLNDLGLSMSRSFDVACAAYDRLMLSCALERGATIDIRVRTDLGERSGSRVWEKDGNFEVVVNLGGATVIQGVELTVSHPNEIGTAGNISWIGLAHGPTIERYLQTWQQMGDAVGDFIRPLTFPATYKPRFGVVLTEAELDALRVDHAGWRAATGETPYDRAAAKAAEKTPEALIGEFVNFWWDTRYCRERDHGRMLLTQNPQSGPSAAIAGVIRKDPELCRLAARYAYSIAMCEHWDDGFICRTPGSSWEHRCFVQSLCAYEVAYIFDLCGEWFTPAGAEFIKRRLAEEGIGSITYNTWRYDYIFTCNQLAWFSPGRLLALTVLEKGWKRAEPYTDIALRELQGSLNDTILADGGYYEGPTYFRCVGRDGGLALSFYAASRQVPFASIAPPSMLRTGVFAALTESTDRECDVISICDGMTRTDQESMAIMAAMLPQSRWTAMYRKSAARDAGVPGSIVAWRMTQGLPAECPPPPPVVAMPVMGAAASIRQWQGHWVKLLMPGNKPRAGHCHEDKGSFILEFAGDTFALDPGTCDYTLPLAKRLGQAERHNMLVPTGLTHRPAPPNPHPEAMIVAITGDAERFEASLDAGTKWQDYTHWTRTWRSPSPDRLTIVDDFELAPNSATGVVFYWQTLLPVTVAADGRSFVIDGRDGRAIVTAPADARIEVETLLHVNDKPSYRVGLYRTATKGTHSVDVLLQVK